MPEKLGSEQIQQLLRDAIEQYEKETGDVIKRNKNPDNYIGLANKLSGISNRLPDDNPEIFEPDTGGRYDITKAQIRDALFGSVDSLKLHFSKALDLYIDKKPILNESDKPGWSQNQPVDPDPPIEPIPPKQDFRKKDKILKVVCAILLILLLFFSFKWLTVRHELSTVKHQFDSTKKHFDTIVQDMGIILQPPTQAKIDEVEGIYKVYMGSPQVRISDSPRYHMVVWDILQITYKEGYGYFVLKRYGPRTDQKGFMQFDRPNHISMRADVINNDSVLPKLIQLELAAAKDTLLGMTCSWSWDTVTAKNVSIGMREVYIRMGKGGSVKPLGKAPKDVNRYQWTKEDETMEILTPQRECLDTLPESLRKLLNEESIILTKPDPNAFHKKPVKRNGNQKTSDSQQ